MQRSDKTSSIAPGLRRIMEMADAFRYSRIVLTAVELDLFSRLGDERKTAQEIALRFKLHPRATEILLNALVGLDLLAKKDSLYFNTTVGKRYLDRSSPEYRGAFLAHVARFSYPWEQLTKVVKTGNPARIKGRSSASDFALAMYHAGLERAEQVTALLDLSQARRVLDLGGGPGHYALAAARYCSTCEVTVFDREETLQVTREIVARHPDVMERMHTMAGDFLDDDIGSNYDLIIGSNIIHSYGEEDAQRIIDKAAAALAPDGRLVIHDFLLNDTKTQPSEAAVFAVHMLIMTGVGRSYSAIEVREWMEKAGLGDFKYMEVDGGPTAILVGKK